MSDSELRKILTDLMHDLETGRLRHWKPRRILRRAVVPALLAASLGLAGCEAEGVGAPSDAADTVVIMYAAPGTDADVDADVDAEPDAEWDCPACLYMAPPPIDPE